MKEDATPKYQANPLDSPQTKQFWPEQKLWWAVLAQASWDVRLTRCRRKNMEKMKDYRQRQAYGRHYDKALAWFNSPSTEIGSFLWICSIFDLHSETIRNIIVNHGIRLSMQWKDTRGTKE